jgi:hypothetical protein
MSAESVAGPGSREGRLLASLSRVVVDAVVFDRSEESAHEA